MKKSLLKDTLQRQFQIYRNPCSKKSVCLTDLFWHAIVGWFWVSIRDTIITDHYFTPDERLTGLELAKELRNRGFAGRTLLASNGEFSPSELNGIVDKIVDKQPVGWDPLGLGVFR